jgi:ribosomal protein RSM22 (predicted rRNA methylase)
MTRETVQLPLQLVEAIESLAAEHDFKRLRAAAERISGQYRAGATGAPLAGDVERAAYLAVRFPATYAAVSAVLEELKARAPQFAPRTMLDLGAGPGTATYAADAVFPSLKDVMLVEQDSGFLALARELCNIPAHRDCFAADLRTAPVPQAELAVAAFALGELPPTDAARVVERAWNASQVLCVIEPGTPRGYATIMRVRDQLIAQGPKPQKEQGGGGNGAAEAAPLRKTVPHLVAPCPHERRCPMDDTQDWCHFAARVERTSLHRKLKAGELGWEDEKFSYVVFAKDPAMARAQARIVRHPQTGKGHIKLELCGPDGLELVTISRKQGEVYRRARRAEWGDSWDI